MELTADRKRGIGVLCRPDVEPVHTTGVSPGPVIDLVGGPEELFGDGIETTPRSRLSESTLATAR